MTSILALDYGMKRIGVASGNLESRIAFPRGVVRNVSRVFVFDELRKYIREWGVEVLVVGLPLAMEESHSMSPIYNEVQIFCDDLRVEFPELNIIMFDERLSTFEADQVMEEMGADYYDKKKMRDAFAAMVVLKRYFQAL